MEGKRPNISDLSGSDLKSVRNSLKIGQVSVASEIIGEHVRRIQSPLPGKPQEVPPQRTQEVQKHHIKRTGK